MKEYKNKLFISTLFLIQIFLILVGRLVYLQIIKGNEFEVFSRENRIRLLKTQSPRGKILDRYGRELVINRASFDIKLFPNEIEDLDKISKDLSALLNTDEVVLKEKIQYAQKSNMYTPIKIASDIGRDTLALIESRLSNLKGVVVEINYVRYYPNGKIASPLLGYLGKVNSRDLDLYPKLDINSNVGRSGIERSLENQLMGKNGVTYKVIDALGREVKSNLFIEDLQDIKNVPGNDVFLTIDANLQKVSEEALKDYSGAVVVVDVYTGEILTLASNPSYNPEKFVNGIDQEDWQQIINDEFHPMLNRATQGTYSPGSTFKIVTAAAALKEKVIDKETKVYCPGYYKLGNKKFRCWKHVGHGWVNLHKAMVYSCDVYFYQVAEKLGIDKLAKYIRLFGFGISTGIEISEKKGLAPSRKWKEKTYKTPWYIGETVLTSIGQGYLNATPLQVSIMTAAIANGGTIIKPSLVKKIASQDGKTVISYSPQAIRRLPFSDEIISEIQYSLEDAVNNRYGTGRNAKIKNVKVAGKTGTAQVVSTSSKTEALHHSDHAWFTSYFPAESPKIAVTVLIEHGGQGGKIAAPIAKKIIESYLNLMVRKAESNHDV